MPRRWNATLAFGPGVSFHMGVPADLIAAAHDRGIVWLQTVGDVDAALAAIDGGADVLIAQGTEAGGNAGWVSTMVLVPAVVDVVGDVPVVAAGGIANGRGIAAALALGAQGVNLGTRFLATVEMTIDQAWKERIVAAGALDAVKVPHSELVMPPFTLPQIGVPFARELCAPGSSPSSSPIPPASIPAGSDHSCSPPCDQVVDMTCSRSPASPPALIHDIVPAGELVRRLVEETSAALRHATRYAPNARPGR